MLATSWDTYSQGEFTSNQAKQVLYGIKNFDFERARSALDELKRDSTLESGAYAKHLGNLLKLSSEIGIGKTEVDYSLLNATDYGEKFIASLSLLNQGLYLFYYSNEKDTEAMAKFEDALKIAQDNDLLELKNEILKWILEYHARYFSVYNDVYKKSLGQLGKNVVDEIDQNIYQYYVYFFKRRKLNQNFESTNDYLGYKDLLDKEIPDFYKGNIYKHLAIDCEYRKDFQKADSLYLLSLSTYPKSNIERINEKLLAANISYAVSLYKQGSYKKSIDILDGVYPKKKGKLINWNLAYLTYWKSKSLFEIGKVDSAYSYISKSFLLQMEFSQEKHIKEVADLQTKYDTAEKEKQILQERQKARANRNWFIASALALVLGAGIAVLLQKNTTKKRLLAEQEVVLKQQRVENLLKEQELVSIDAMIAGQEKERQKVAGELHDDLGSLMATIKLHFDNVQVSQKDPALQSARKLLEEAYQKVRGMAHHKHSGVMSDQGLLPAIKKMARTISETNALTVTVEDFGMGERMENSLELSIFRMIQELMANVIKHAEASQVTIQLTQHEENLNIIVEDNGKGFDRTKLNKEQSGMGLTTIEKRVEHLEGNFTIDSVLGKGTSILIDIPV